MAKLFICMADGCEEVEALTVVDLVRRAGIQMDMVSITGNKTITGSHNIVMEADALMEDVDLSKYDGVVLPGGMPGTNHLKADERVLSAIKTFAKDNKLVAAICAAPTVLGYAGLLEGKKATCYPGMEDGLLGATKETKEVVEDGNIITSRGLGTAVAFGLSVVSYFTDEKTAQNLGNAIVYKAN